jgi:hypothetical protein
MSGRKTFVGGDILLASEINGFLQDQAVMVFDDAAARTTAIPSPAEGMVTFLKSSDTLEAWNGSAFVNVASVGTSAFRFVTTVYFTSSGTFSKATYPWLRAIRVKCQGGGGGGGGVASGPGVAAAGGGGSGGSAESFITDIAGLDASVTVTTGVGGAGRSGAGNISGFTGGTSSFGSLSALGGGGGEMAGAGVTDRQGGSPGTASGADLAISGFAGHASNSFRGGAGGGFGGGDWQAQSNSGLNATGSYGGGGGGALQGDGTSRAGGNGANGIVIIELYA